MLPELFAQAKFQISPVQLSQLEHFLKIFQEKNAVVNLSAIREEKEIIIKHFLDSLTVTRLPAYLQATKIIDLGTGGGFPGLPLAIFSREKKFTLVDSTAKKIAAITAFVQELQLTNVMTVTSRAEELGQNQKYREQFDMCVSRAVAYLPTLLEYALPFVRPDGYFIAYKEQAGEELAASAHALEVLGGRLEKVETYVLPEVAQARELLIFRKIKVTPKMYPREIGVPSKKPL